MSFANGTGFGWDNLHPRALTQLPRRLILQLVMCMVEAEISGGWPPLLGWVVIVLLPKTEGGRRPIRLIPCLPRIWSRARRGIAGQWRRVNSRQHLYGGVGKVAAVAAWKQAARAELAVRGGKSYDQGLPDLVKAYERIPHWILLR